MSRNMSEKAKANKQEYDLKYVKQNIKRIKYLLISKVMKI